MRLALLTRRLALRKAQLVTPGCLSGARAAEAQAHVVTLVGIKGSGLPEGLDPLPLGRPWRVSGHSFPFFGRRIAGISYWCTARRFVELRGACSALRAARRSACLDSRIDDSVAGWSVMPLPSKAGAITTVNGMSLHLRRGPSSSDLLALVQAMSL